MKKYLFLVISIILCSCNKDQDDFQSDFKGQLAWAKTFGGSLEDKATSVVATPDGGVLVVGYTKSNNGDVIKTHAGADVLITKIDASGNTVYSKTIGGSLDDFGYSIIRTSDNNYVISGYSGSADFDVPSNQGFHDFYIVKINENADIIWSKSYGFSSHDHAHKIIQTQDGGFFVAGFSDYSGIIGAPDNGEGHTIGHKATNPYSVQHGVGEFMGIKLDAQGEFLWYRYYGGTQNDRVNDIVETNDGGIIMVGYSESQDFDVENPKGSYDYWVINLDKDGHLHWKKSFGGSDIDQAYGIAKTDFNSYLIVGQSNSVDGDISSHIGNSDIWVIHINHHGDLLWEKSFGGVQFETAYSIKKNKNGRFYIAGNSRSNDVFTNIGQNDALLIEIDAHPNTGIYWSKTFGGSSFDIAYDFTQTTDGSIILVGDTESNDNDFTLNKGSLDQFVIKVE